MFDKRPFEERSFIYTYKEAARVAGVQEWCLCHWRKRYPGFPSFPTTKGAVVAYMQRNGLPRPRRAPTPMRFRVIALREAGRSFREIGIELGMSKQAAHTHWKRHLRRIQRQLRRTIPYVG